MTRFIPWARARRAGRSAAVVWGVAVLSACSQKFEDKAPAAWGVIRDSETLEPLQGISVRCARPEDSNTNTSSDVWGYFAVYGALEHVADDGTRYFDCEFGGSWDKYGSKDQRVTVGVGPVGNTVLMEK